MKKGFTLVELLGVITILGLIAVIVFPNISKSIKNSKENLYREQVDLIEKSATRWGTDHLDELNKYLATKIPLSALITGGYLSDKTVKDPRNDSEMNGCVIAGFDEGYEQYTYKYYEQSCNDIALETSDNCFTFDKDTGTITDYNNDCPKDVTIPDSIDGTNVTILGNNSFYTKQLRSITLPSTVVIIGERALEGNLLTEITLPDSVIEIKSWAFKNNQLTNVVIPDNVTSIGEATFAINQLTSVTLGSGLTTIGNHTFEHNKLLSLTVPDNIVSIGEAAFANNELTSVTFGSGLTTIGIHAFNTNKIEALILPNNITSIGASAFTSNQLTSIVLSSGLTEIEARVFYSNRLTTVTIPSNINAINLNAFLYNQLTSVIIQGKSNSTDFTTYTPGWGWATGYSDANITWNG